MIVSRRKHTPSAGLKPSARALAYSILLSVETASAYASELLRSRLDPDLDEREAALTTELVMGTLRWQRLLDFFIERYSRRSVASLDPEVLIVLRLGIYQLRYLTRVPARAAVSESVELMRHARKHSATTLVNALLRRAAAEKDEPVTQFLPHEIDPIEAVAISQSQPTWLVRRWLRRFDESQMISLLQSNNRAPEHSLAVLNPGHREDSLRSLDEAGIAYGPGHLLRDALAVKRGRVDKTEAFRNGWISIQDEASQMIPMLLDAKPGDNVLDLCAAPGGKTIALAHQVGAQGRVVASDLHEARLRAMRQRPGSSESAKVLFVALDGTQPLPFAGLFQRILVDASCSGTGTLGRNPEIRWRLTEENLTDLHRRQTALVTSALTYLTPNGALLYSTCSLEAEENESVVREALAATPGFRVEPVKVPKDRLAPHVRADDLIDEEGAFRIFPPMHHTDGFFAALVRQR